MRQRLVRGPEDVVDYTQLLRSHDEWPDHQLRVAVSSAILRWMKPTSILDPACGNGDVVIGARAAAIVTLADISQPNMIALAASYPGINWLVGDVFDTLDGTEPVDTIVLTEIVEHVESPVKLLSMAGAKAQRLLVSSPEMRPGQIDHNPEHIWMFDGEGYEELLNETGWKAYHKTHLTFRSDYDFQIWVCERSET